MTTITPFTTLTPPQLEAALTSIAAEAKRVPFVVERFVIINDGTLAVITFEAMPSLHWLQKRFEGVGLMVTAYSQMGREVWVKGREGT